MKERPFVIPINQVDVIDKETGLKMPCASVSFVVDGKIMLEVTSKRTGKIAKP